MYLTEHARTLANSTVDEPILGREADMERNAAGGFVFRTTDATVLDRFLILGTEGGTYYVTEQKLTREAASTVVKMLTASEASARNVVDRAVEISQAGRAPKNDAALFVLALASSVGHADARSYALKQLPKVARTATHLFQFIEMVQAFRGWGRSLKRAVADWYLSQTTEKVAYQAIKYRNRAGWSHRDVLRKAHPKTTDVDRAELFDWICRGTLGDNVPTAVLQFDALQQATSAEQAAEMLSSFGLPREAVPTQFLNDRAVWQALLTNMPITALVRNLNKMTMVGLFDNKVNVDYVVSRLIDPEQLKRGRVHPFAMLVAWKTYASGQGHRGSNTWTPHAKIVQALAHGFEMAFDFLPTTDERVFIGIDVSGSMGWSFLNGNSPVNCREASAAMLMVHMRQCSQVKVGAFTNHLLMLQVDNDIKLDSMIDKISRLPFGGTNVGSVIEHAINNNLQVDKFVIYTDNETWQGSHVTTLLAKYRKQSGINAKLIVVAMETSNHSVADPNDPLQLDIVGFDTATPQVLAEF